MFPEGMDMNALLQQAQAMQAQLQQAQDDLANSVFTGTAGGDLVQAVVTGAGELVGLTIDPSAVDTDDLDLLKEELGDVLLQVALHAEIESEQGTFDINDIFMNMSGAIITFVFMNIYKVIMNKYNKGKMCIINNQ